MACEISPTDRRLLSAGGFAGIVFCGVAIFGILTRPGFDLQRHAVSSLSLGEGGWTMVAAFIASGVLTLLCAIGLSRVLKEGRGRRALPILIGLYGFGLVIAGVFPAPACCGFPAGTPEDLLPVMTPGAIVHSIAFMVAFSSLIIACFIAALRLLGGSSLLSLLAGIFMPLLVGLGIANAIAPGIAFFIAAIIGWVWLAALVMQLAGDAAEQPEPALASQS
jgi:MFS family permease